MIRTVAVTCKTARHVLPRRNFSIHEPVQNSLQTTNLPIVNKLQFINSVTGSSTRIPIYRVLDGIGKPIEGAELPEVSF